MVPNTAAYEGCVSWVELDVAQPTAGALPALPDEQFAAIRAELLGRLGAAAVPV
jgi:hypothetical protein